MQRKAISLNLVVALITVVVLTLTWTAPVVAAQIAAGLFEAYAPGDLNGLGSVLSTAVSPGPADYAFEGTAGDDGLCLVLNGANAEIYSGVAYAPGVDCTAGTLEVSLQASDLQRLAIDGLGGDDTLIVSFAGGDPIPAGGLDYDGGAQTSSDDLVIDGGAFGMVQVDFGATNGSGTIDLDGSAIAFSGLEPLLLNAGTAGDVVYNLPLGTCAAVSLQNDAANAGNSQIAGADFEDTSFTNPASSLTVNDAAGCGRTFALEAMDATFDPAAGLALNASDGDDTLDVTATTGTAAYALAAGDGDDLLYVDNSTAAGGDTYAVSAAALSGGMVNLSYTGVETLSLDTGDGSDTVDVSPSAATAYDLDGMAPTTLPGDTLNVDAGGNAVTWLPWTPGSAGTVEVAGMQPIDHDHFEDLNVLDGPAQLVIDKSVVSDEICLGAYGFYEIVIRNDGPSDSANVTVTDVLSDALIYGGGSPECSHDGSPVGGTVTCTLESLAFGESYDFIVGFALTDTVGGGTLISNTATVSSTMLETEPGDNTSAAVGFTASQCSLPEVELSVSKAVEGLGPLSEIILDVLGIGYGPGYTPAVAGGQVWYRLTVTNAGTTTASDVVLYDALPPGFRLVDVAFDANYALDGTQLCTGDVTCTLGDVPPHDSVLTVLMVVGIDPDVLPSDLLGLPLGDYVNTVVLRSANPDPEPADNVAEAAVQVIRVTTPLLFKTGIPDPVEPGDELTYQIYAANAGPSDDIFLVYDMLPPALDPDTVVVEASDGVCAFDLLIPNLVTCIFKSGLGKVILPNELPIPIPVDQLPLPGMSVITVRGTVQSWVTDTFTNEATIMPLTSEPLWLLPWADTHGVETDVEPRTDLVIAKTATPTAHAGGEIDYSLTVHNRGPAEAQIVVVTDTLPPGVAVEGYSQPACSYDGVRTVVCTVDGLAVDSTAAFTISVRADDDLEPGSSLENVAVVAAETSDPNLANNRDDADTSIVGLTDLVLTKVRDPATPATVVAGEAITYVIAVENDGPSVAQSVEVVDELPAGVRFVSATVERSARPDPVLCGGAVCQVGDLAAGEVATITLVGLVDPGIEAGSYLTNTATVFSDTPEETLDNNSDSVETRVTTSAMLYLTKNDLLDPVWMNTYVGTDDIVYVLTVRNNGPSDAYETVLSDTLPAELRSGGEIVYASFAGLPLGDRCSFDGTSNVVTCNLGHVPAGETVEVYIKAQVRPALALASSLCGRTVTNAAGLSWFDSVGANTRATSEETTVYCENEVDLKKRGPTEIDFEGTAPPEFTYVLTATNSSVAPLVAGGLRLEDEIPAGLTFVGYRDAGCRLGLEPGSDVVFTNTAPIAAGGVCRVEIDVRLEDQAEVCPAGLIFNEAQAHVAGPPPSMDQAVWLTQVDCGTALAVVKTPLSGGPVVAGGEYLFGIAVTNAGNVTAYDVELTDHVLGIAGAEIYAFLDLDGLPIVGQCTTGGFCNLGDLPAGETMSVVAAVRIASDERGAPFIQEACAEADNAELACDRLGPVEVLAQADVRLIKQDLFDPAFVNTLGDSEDLFYVVTVRNVGPSDAYDVVFGDTLPAGTTVDQPPIFYPSWGDTTPRPGLCAYDPATNEASCAIGTLPAGESLEIYVALTVDGGAAPGLCGTTVLNQAEVTWDDDLSQVRRVTAEESTDLVCQTDLDLKKRGPEEIDFLAASSPPVTYVLTATNTGPSPIVTGELTLEDAIPAGLAVVGWSSTCELSEVPGSNIAFTNSVPIPAGGTCTVVIEAAADAAEVCPAGIIFNEAQAHSHDSMDQAVWLTQADCSTTLDITKDALGPFVAGGTAAFDIIVTNTGNVTAFGPELTDNIRRPWTGVRIVNFRILNTSFGYAITGGECSDAGFCNLPDLPPGESLTVRARVEIDPDLDTDRTGLALEQFASVEADNAGIEWTAVTGDITSQVTLSIQKEDLVDYAVAGGDPVLYVMTVRNTGPSHAYNVVVNDTPAAPWFTLVGDLEPGNRPMLCSGDSCTITRLEAGASLEIYAALVAAPDTPPGVQLANTACIEEAAPYIEIVNGLPNPDLLPLCANERTKVRVAADLAIDKTGPLTVTTGSVFSYTVTVYNSGPSDAQSLVVTDTLPYGVGLLDYEAPEGFFCDDGPESGTIVCSGDGADYVLPVSESLEIVLWVLAEPDVCYAGKVNNYVAVGSDTPDPDLADNDDDWGTVILNRAEVTVEKAATPVPAVAGDLVSFVLTVANEGPGCATDVVLVDALGSADNVDGLEMVSYDSSVSTDEAEAPYYWGYYSCSSGGVCQRGAALYQGVTDTLLLTMRIPADAEPGEYFNDAEVRWDSGAATNWAAYDVVAVATLGVEKDDLGEAIVAGGEPLHYVVSVWNEGPSDAYDVVIADAPLAPWFRLADEGLVPGNQVMTCTTVSCTIPVIPAGGSVEVYATITATADAPAGYYYNANEACVTDADNYEFTTPCSVEGTRIVAQSDLAIDKRGPLTVTAGATFDYQVTVYNNGPSDARGVAVTDRLPYGVSYVSDTDSCELAESGVLACALPEALAAGEAWSFTITVVSDVDVCYEGKINNYAQVSSTTSDPDPANNDDDWGTVILNQVDLGIEKTVAPDPVTAGELFSIIITATNAGPGCATDVKIIDEMWEGLELTAYGWSGDAYWCDAGVDCFRTLPMLTGVVDTITLYVRMPPDRRPGSHLNYASILSDDADRDLADNETTYEYKVVAESTLGIAKDDLGEEIVAGGDPLQYVVTVWNEGPSAAYNVVVTDTPLAPWFSLVGDLVPGDQIADCAAASCTIPVLPAGESVAIYATMAASVDTPAGEWQANTACIVSSDNLTYTTPCDAEDTTALLAADVAIDKVAVATVHAGQPITYTLHVYNNGPSTAASVAVTDTLPPLVTFASASPGCAETAPGSGVIACTLDSLAAGDAVDLAVVVVADRHIEIGTSLENVAVANSDTLDRNRGNNADTADTSVISFDPVHRYYLPVIHNDYRLAPQPLPDLVASFGLTPNTTSFGAGQPVTITVVVSNQGTMPAGAFWVDFYFNPDPRPTYANLPWQHTCESNPAWCYGIAWQVPPGLAPGQSIVLTSTPDSYDAMQTYWPGSLMPGTTEMWVYVDSWYPLGNLGAVLESNEANNYHQQRDFGVTGALLNRVETRTWPPRSALLAPQ